MNINKKEILEEVSNIKKASVKVQRTGQSISKGYDKTINAAKTTGKLMDKTGKFLNKSTTGLIKASQNNPIKTTVGAIGALSVAKGLHGLNNSNDELEEATTPLTHIDSYKSGLFKSIPKINTIASGLTDPSVINSGINGAIHRKNIINTTGYAPNTLATPIIGGIGGAVIGGIFDDSDGGSYNGTGAILGTALGTAAVINTPRRQIKK
jgi:hypothetical protein